MSQAQALTVGMIAERLGCPVHKIQYILKARRISPSQRVGPLRLFDEEHVAQIGEELKRVEERKAVG